MADLHFMKDSPAAGIDASGGKIVGQETVQADGTTLWEMRTEEQPYALLSDKVIPDTNRYGQKIDLIELTEGKLPANRPMYINENPELGTNPNRNKQHAFFFTADNCIGCHACEAACSEKNENPAHIAFRSVGYVEGGSYPDYKRMNISMACNHCDDPVCLKGCPTRAYTKHVEYGAVLQDPETCFGCGYCTWVCPYNAPQLDPIKGQVSKCNMCVDRLEVGLKPACVSACLGNALDFGVVENIPENREEARTTIPGFPDPSITHPNIRFQQIKNLPEEMNRTDSMPVKYHKDKSGNYKPAVDQKKQPKVRHWNFKRLSSRENPLVLFTLASQAAIGAFAMAFLGAQFGIDSLVSLQHSVLYAPLAILSFLMTGFGLFMSTMHLGKPKRFYRGFNNLRHSPVCREGLGIAGFMGFLSLHILCNLPANSLIAALWSGLLGSDISASINTEAARDFGKPFGYLAILFGLAGLYYMNRCYRIKARPFWNHWQVATSFAGNALSLGGLLAGSISAVALGLQSVAWQPALQLAAGLVTLGVGLELIGLFFHARAMRNAEHEGAASHYVQQTTFGNSYYLRNGLLSAALIVSLSLLLADLGTAAVVTGWITACCLILASSLIGRALFYVLVIPTTMPGAFFWKNKGFEEHARDIGLAHMPQVGVIPNVH